MKDLGLSVIEAGHPPHFAQPCSKLDGSICSVYANRPQNCRGFRCRVLERLESGDLDLVKAQAIIQKAVSLVAACAEGVPTVRDRTRSLWTWLEAFVGAQQLQLDGVDYAPVHLQLEHCVLTLRRLLDDEFKPLRLPGDEI